MDKVVSAASAFNASMDKVEAQLKQVTNDYQQATRAANDFDRSVDGATGSINVHVNATKKASKSTQDWATDFIRLRQNVELTSVALSKLSTASSRISLISRSAKAFDAFGGQDKPITALTKAFVALGGASTVFGGVKSRILGLDDAMSKMPMWQRQMVNFSGTVSGLTKAFNLVEQTSNIGKIWSSAVGNMAKVNQDAALSMVKFGDSVKEFAKPLEPAIQSVTKFGKTIEDLAGKPAKAIQGFALMKSGLSGLSKNFGVLTGEINSGSYVFDAFAKGLRFILLPGILLSSAAIEALGKSLVLISNTVAGLWDGIKQLSGGFLALPGLIATIGAIALPAVAVVKNLTAAFKTIGSAKGDIDKINAAVAAMPPYMRPLAETIVDLTDKWKGFQDTLTNTFITGAADQLKSLAAGVLPQVSAGSDQVANSFRIAKDQLVAFVAQGKTISAMLTIFSNASQIMNTVSSSIGAVGGGFRDIAVVGSTFIKQLAEDYIPVIAGGFSNWAKAAVESGRAMSWMNDSVMGVKNLARGLDEALKATFNFLTVFKSGPQTNWLKTFADEMTKFNAEVTKSAQSGDLGKIAGWVKQLGTSHISVLKDMFKEATPGIKAFLGILNDAGNALNTVMIPTIKAAIAVIGPMLQALNFAGIGTLIGGEIFGVSGAFKVLMFTIGPVVNGLKAVYGAFTAFKAMSGFQNVVIGVATSLTSMNGVGAKVGQTILNLGESVVAASAAIGSALAAVVGGFLAWQAQSQFVSNANKIISDSSKQAAEDVDKLRKAFEDDKGVAGSNVFGAEQKSIQDVMDSTSKLAATAPSLMAQVGASLKNFNPFGSGDSIKEFDQFDDATQKAAQAKQGFDQLKMSSQELSQQITGQTSGFDETINKLEQMGASGKAAADVLLDAKKSFDLTAASARDAGPAALQLAAGIEKLASAGGDASSKLDGLKTALEGLGLLKTNDYQAVADYAKSIHDLADAAAKAVDPTQGLGDVIDQQTGLLNAASVNGGNLLNVLAPMAENFLNLASRGHDVNQMWSDLQPQLQQVAKDFGLTGAQIDKIVQSMGVDPKIVKILVQLEGKDAFHQEMAEILAKAQAEVGNGVEIPIHLKNPADAQKLVDKINGAVGNKNASRADNGNVFLAPGISQKEVDALGGNFGIDTGNAPVPTPGLSNQQVAPPPADGRSIPVAPEGAPTPQTAEQKAAAKKAAEPAKAPAPEHLSSGMPQPLLPPRPTTAKGASIAPAAPVLSWHADAPPAVPVPPTPAVPEAPAAPTEPAVTPGAAVPIAPSTLPPLNVTVTGLDELSKASKAVNEAAGAIAKSWQTMTDSINKNFVTMLASINQFTTQAVAQLTKASQAAFTAGQKFTSDFARGIASGAGAAGPVAQAASLVAQRAQNYMPQHSPAKEGPLSGDGWSGVAGKKFSTDFAGGVEDGVSNISGSVKKAAAAAKLIFAGLTKGVPDNSKDFLKQFQDLTALAGNFQKMFTQTFNTGAKFLQSMSDPFKTGGFFGSALGYQRDPKVTAAELADRRQKGDSGVGGDLTGGASSLANIQAPSKEDIAAAIAGEAMKRGYDRNTAVAVTAAAMHESGMDSNITNASGHHGLFQESSDKPSAGASQQIDWMFNQLDQLGGPGNQSLKSDPLDTIASQIERGGYTGAALGPHTVDAAKLYDAAINKAGSVGVGPNAAFQGVGQGYSDNPASRAKETAGYSNVEQGVQAKGIAPLYTPGGGVPQWMSDLAAKFNLTASTYGNGGSLHQMGFAADFNAKPDDPNGSKMMEAFAAYIDQNLKGQTLQLIHQGQSGQKYGVAAGEDVGPGTSQPNYYASDFGGHGDHVHWATDVAPILGAGNASAANGQNEQVLSALRSNNSTLDQAIKVGQNPSSTDQEVASSLQTLKQASIEQNQTGTPESKQNAQAIDSLTSTIASNRGMKQSQDPISSAQGVIGGASQIAGDVIGDINDTIQAIGATKNSADMLVRGIANTQDVMKIIDNTQQWLSTFAQYAQTVGDVANEVGQVANAASEGEPGGGSISGIAGIIGGVADAISGALQGVNEAIDLAQEIYQIWGSYYGNFLGFLSGGNNSLQGNVQYLLDQNTNQLLAYSTDNPMLKDAHQLPGALANPAANNQAIGQLNYYAGPGTDPREATRQMMFQVKSAGFAGAIAP